MEPIKGPVNKPMFNGIEVDVICVAVHIVLVSDKVVPKTMLPNSSGGHTSFRTIQHTKTHFHTLHDICIIFTSRIYDAVKVIGQDNVRK